MNDSTHFVGMLANWLCSNNMRIAAAMNTRAAWEIWLQVEMAIYINQLCGNAVREQHYDNSRKSVDILCKYGNTAIALELKAQSLQTYMVSGGSMIDALRSDVDKLNHLSLINSAKAMNCSKIAPLVLGIGIPDTYNNIAQQLFYSPFFNHSNLVSMRVMDAFAVYGYLFDDSPLF